MRFRKSPIEFRCIDAAEAYYTDGTLYILFNPFGEEILRVVLQRIRQTLTDKPRKIRIGYLNPVHESVLKECGWLCCVGHRQPGISLLRASY
jgi:hypothetical protein